jgi:hypothetical protein
VKVKSPEKSVCHFVVGREKEHCFVRRFPGFPARPSDKSRVKVKEDVRMFRNSDLRQGPRNFDFLD